MLSSDLNYSQDNKGSTLYDLDSLFQAALTLIQTKQRTKPFKPQIGNLLDDYLFEPCDADTAYDILLALVELFKQDPRFKLDAVRTTVTAIPAKETFKIDLVISFPMVGEQTYSITYLLSKSIGS